MAGVNNASDARSGLAVTGLGAGYGATEVLFDVAVRLEAGEIVVLLGRNGAGKSTTLKAIMGLVPARRGSIRLNGEEIVGKGAYLRCRMGLGYVPQERRIFPDLTVEENLEIGEWRGDRAGVRRNRDRVYEAFPTLRGLRARQGGSLSGGEQQMLTIGRTLMGAPRLLLLDEPSEGLAPTVVRALAAQILRLKDEGMGILLSEQNLQFTRRVCDRAYVVDMGRIRWSGSRDDLATESTVYSKYLLL
jgi:branched-chain amino acid transport system ATP-binding protein